MKMAFTAADGIRLAASLFCFLGMIGIGYVIFQVHIWVIPMGVLLFGILAWALRPYAAFGRALLCGGGGLGGMMILALVLFCCDSVGDSGWFRREYSLIFGPALWVGVLCCLTSFSAVLGGVFYHLFGARLLAGNE